MTVRICSLNHPQSEYRTGVNSGITPIISHSDLMRGDLVIWKHRPRGGYGYEFRVLAKVHVVRPKRITIEVIWHQERVKRIVYIKALERPLPSDWIYFREFFPECFKGNCTI